MSMQIDAVWLNCDCCLTELCFEPVIYQGSCLPVDFDDMSKEFLDSCRERSNEKGDELEGWKFKVSYDTPKDSEYLGQRVESDVVCPECTKIITNVEEL